MVRNGGRAHGAPRRPSTRDARPNPAAAYDIAFVDTPFTADLWSAATQALETNGWLRPSAWIYLEMPIVAAPQVPEAWLQHRESTAGAVRYALYRRISASAKL